MTDNHREDAADARTKRNLKLIGSGRTGHTAVDLSLEAPDILPALTGGPPCRSGAPDYYVFEWNRDDASR